MRLKTAKVAIRGLQLVGGLIPGGALPAAIVSAVAKTGVKLTFTNATSMAAAGIHWRAFLEQAISGGRGKGKVRKIGPGSQIFYEIFTKRSMTRLLGNYDIEGLIQEPGGLGSTGRKAPSDLISGTHSETISIVVQDRKQRPHPFKFRIWKKIGAGFSPFSPC